VAQHPTTASSPADKSGSEDKPAGLLPPRIEEKTRTIATGISKRNKNAVNRVAIRLKENIDIKNDIFAKKILVPGRPIIVKHANHAAVVNIGKEFPTPKIL
jgi:hypothetical protein